MVATYDFIQTRDQIIKRALRIVGVLADGDTPTTDQVNNAADALNAMVKRWQNEHVFLWTLTDYQPTIVAGTPNYSLSAQNFNGIHKVFRRDSSGYDFQLEIIKYSEYLEIVTKSLQGYPEKVAFDGKLSSSIYLYPNPSQVFDIHVVGIKLLADFDAAGDSPDAGSNWIDALVYGLADSLADEYILPSTERQYIHAKAETFKQSAKGSDVESFDSEFSSGAY